jgi:alanine racemase
MKRSRKKYTETERIYIDQRIDSALERFGINPEEFQRTVGSSERIPDVVFPEDVDAETLSLDDLLLHFIGKRRMASSKAIRDEELRIDKVTDEFIVARVKEYLVKVDIKSRIFAHNCGDWIAWMSEKLMCKHVAKLLSMMNPEMATNLLRDLCRNKGEWTFSSTPREIFA